MLVSFNEHPGRNLFRSGREEDQVVDIPPLSFLGSPIQIEVHGNEMSPHYAHRGTGVMLIVSHSLGSSSLRIFYP